MHYKDYRGDSIELTDERWRHITMQHPEMAAYKQRIAEVLESPDYVKQSARDPESFLYYRFYEDVFQGKYLLVAVKKGVRSFVLTCYITDTLKRGATIWEKK
jgi:hypothetical protein